jgi:hypothetical protein
MDAWMGAKYMMQEADCGTVSGMSDNRILRAPSMPEMTMSVPADRYMPTLNCQLINNCSLATAQMTRAQDIKGLAPPGASQSQLNARFFYEEIQIRKY